MQLALGVTTCSLRLTLELSAPHGNTGMAAPTIAQVSQVGQGQGGGSGMKFGHTPGTHTTRHSRSYIQYVSNAMDATGLNTSTGVIDEGWQYVPYRSLRASINPRIMRNKMQASKAFKVKKLGFSVKHFNPLVEQIVTRAGSTALDNVFENKPFVMKLVDHELVLDNLLQTKNGDKKWNTANTNLTRAYPVSQVDGALPRVDFNMGQEFVDSLENTGVYKEQTDAWGSFNTLSGFNVTTHDPGQEFGYSWAPKGGDTRWYPIGNYTGHKAEDEFPDPASADYDIGAIEYNLKTQINQNFLGKPPPVLLRVNPVHGVDGPINISGYMFVTYFSEVEWSESNPALLTQNLNSDIFDGTERDAWQMAKTPVNYNLVYPNGLSSWQQEYTYETPDAARSYHGPRAHPYRSEPDRTGGHAQRGLPLPGSAPQAPPPAFGQPVPQLPQIAIVAPFQQ